MIKDRDATRHAFAAFLHQSPELRDQLVAQLKSLRDKFVQSQFFAKHEVIGSSLLIIHDKLKVGVWMIDFGMYFSKLLYRFKLDVTLMKCSQFT